MSLELTIPHASQANGRAPFGHDDGRLVDRVVPTACGPAEILYVDQRLAVRCPIQTPHSAPGSET